MAGPDLAGHPGAAGEGNHPDAVQQVVEEHRGCVHQTGQTEALAMFIIYTIRSGVCEDNGVMSSVLCIG